LDENEHTFKIVFLGDAAVGKTSLITRYTTTAFREEYHQTLGCQLNVAEIQVSDILIRLIIWDLAGQPRFDAVRKLYFLGTDAAVVVYSVTDRQSFMNVDGWLQAFQRVVPSPEQVPLILVRNKIDLESQRTVNGEEGVKRYANLVFNELIETSAKTGDNVLNLFSTVTRLLIQYRLTELQEKLSPFFFSSFAS
jgi:small GTP-binding protein